MADTLEFPVWLKLRRRGLGWTQEQLAKRCFCAVISIKRIESGDLVPSQQLAESIGREVGVAADRLAEFSAFARDATLRKTSVHFDAPPTVEQALLPATPRFRLPAALNSFVGRVTELADVSQLLGQPDVRLVTLHGPPGSGKTRLAQHVAQLLQASFADGACFVALSTCRSDDDVINALTRALQIKPAPDLGPLEALHAQLGPRKLLLVLDNFEQVVSSSPLIIGLLAAAPGLTALVTSREPLRVSGEVQYPVAPLASPENTDDVILLAQNEAVRLFADRVRAVKPDFALNSQTVHAVADICRALDGVPLAIEMAATRVKYAGVDAVNQNLRTHLSTLGNPLRDAETRHRTLRDAITWSLDLQPPEQRELFAALGVLEGGCTAETAAALISPEDPAAFDTGRLFMLSEANLLRAHRLDDGSFRFTQLGIFRDDARSRLRAAGNPEVLSARAARMFGQLVQQAQQSLYGPDQPKWLDRLDAEHANIHAAQQWALTHDVVLALRIVSLMTDARYVRGHWAESIAAHAAAVAAARGAPPAPELTPALANALRTYGFMAYTTGDIEHARQLCEEALTLSTGLNDTLAIAAVQRNLGMVHGERADWEAALRAYEISLALYTGLGNRAQMAWLKELIGQLHLNLAGHDRARVLLAEALDLRRAVGGQRGVAQTLFWLGRNEFCAGDYEASLVRMRESVAMSEVVRDTQGLALALCGLAASCEREGRLDEAATAIMRTLPLMRALNYRTGLAWALNVHGDVLMARGDRAGAQAALTEGARLAHHLKDWSRAAACLEALAQCRLPESAADAAALFGASRVLRAQARKPVLAAERARHDALAQALPDADARALPFEQLPLP